MRLGILLVFFIISGIIPAFSYDFIEGGIAYQRLEDGTLCVTHKQGDNWNPSKNIDDHRTYRGDVRIPAEVTHQGKRYKVTKIGKHAFYFCSNLKSVEIPEGIREIEEEAFACNMGSLTSLNIPASVSRLHPGFALHCQKLSGLTVSPKNMYYLSEGNCIYDKKKKQLILVGANVRNYKFPPTVTSVVDYAFYTTSINKLVIPSTLTYIGGKAFSPDGKNTIICKKRLKKLPSSKQYMNGMDLPEWATRH